MPFFYSFKHEEDMNIFKLYIKTEVWQVITPKKYVILKKIFLKHVFFFLKVMNYGIFIYYGDFFFCNSFIRCVWLDRYE